MKFGYWGTLAPVILVLITAVVLLYAFRPYSLVSADRQVTQTTLTASPAASALVTEPIDAGSRTSCATRVLTALVGAINSHDEAALGRIIASGPSAFQAFQWVSMTTSSEVGAVSHGTGVNEWTTRPPILRSQSMIGEPMDARRNTLRSLRGSCMNRQ